MVLIDTSVWIGLFRKRSSPFGELVWNLVAKNEAAVCGQVLVEYVGGFRDKKRRKEFGEPFFEFPFLVTRQEAFQLASQFLADFPSLGPGDAIIAATAVDHKIPLLTCDGDFQVLSRHGLELLA